MKRFGKVALSALMIAGAAAFFAVPASADGGVGISFGFGPGYESFSDPCDYYDYYDEAPPWGLPPDYCDYPVNFDPVYFDGYWYRGPIYYRYYHGDRLFWLNGGWRHDGWRGSRPDIRWQDRGGWGRGDNWNRGGHNWSGGGDRGGRGGSWSGGNGGGGHNWSGDGDRGGRGGGWPGGNGGGHN